MARRKRKKQSSKNNLLPIIIGIVAVIAVIGAAIFFLNKPNDSSKYNQLSASELYTNPNALRGSDFSVTAKVTEKANFSDTKGTLVFVEIIENSKVYPFGFIVPNDTKGPNLSTQQNYVFNGTVDSSGRFIVDSYDDK